MDIVNKFCILHSTSLYSPFFIDNIHFILEISLGTELFFIMWSRNLGSKRFIILFFYLLLDPPLSLGFQRLLTQDMVIIGQGSCYQRLFPKGSSKRSVAAYMIRHSCCYCRSVHVILFPFPSSQLPTVASRREWSDHRERHDRQEAWRSG